MSENQSNKGSVSSIRRDYSRSSLLEDKLCEDPVKQFQQWFDEALAVDDMLDSNAMTLSTVSKQGKPSSRMVLLKGVDEEGFQFYTNYNSRKGQHLAVNAHAALCFFWADLERQVRIQGEVTRVSRQVSANYFRQRPRDSQLGAWASHQSEKVDSRKQLELQRQEVSERFEGQEIPLPDFWGGYVLKPSRIEFWQGRSGRLHDRICYEQEKGKKTWNHFRLAP